MCTATLDLPYQYDFFIHAAIAGTIVAITAAVLGVFVYYRRLTFLVHGVSHSAVGAAAIAAAFGGAAASHESWIVYLGAVIVAILVGFFAERNQITEESAVGIIFPALLAAGYVILQKSGSGALVGLLFGSILSVGTTDTLVAAINLLLVLLCVVILRRPLILAVFDRRQGAISNLPVTASYYCLLGLLATTTVIAGKVVGYLLTTSLFILPAITAIRIRRRLVPAIIFSVLIAVVTLQLGLLASYYFDTPPGATIVLIATIFYGVAGVGRGS